MEWFYTEEDWSALKKQEQKLTAAFRILAAATAAVFVVLCLLIRTGNARVMHAVLLAVTGALGGTAVEASDRSGAKPRKASRIRSFFRGVSLVTLPLILWLFFTVIFGSFVFYQITDTDPTHKLTLYVDGEVRNEAQLAALLEKELPEPIRMVQVHPFSYAMFGSDALRAADLYIVPDSEKEQYADWFAPGEEALTVCDPGGAVSVAGSWILYAPGETYRLYIGAYSPHLSDGLARRGAEVLMALETKEE